MRLAINFCFLFAGAIIFCGCIQEMDTFRKADILFVVDGTITNQKGPHPIKINFTKPFNTGSDFSAVSAATIEVVDDIGSRHLLRHRGKDLYETDTSFQGVVGRSYHLEIQLRDGRRYESLPEEILPVPEIEEAWYQRELIEILTDDDVLVTTPRIVYRVRFKDPEGVKNYYRWRYQGTYQVLAPEADSFGDRPISRRCADRSARPNKDCWVPDFDTEVLKVDSDEFFDGKEVDDYVVFGLELDLRRRFMIGYYNVIYQQSLSKSAYDYLHSIQTQMGNKGTIFETSNFHISGNVRSVDNPDEIVLGYVVASAVAEKAVFVNAANLPDVFEPKDCSENEIGCIPISCIDCRQISSLSSNIKPVFWPLP